MGNNNSAGTTEFKDGTLAIELDHQHYMTGQAITGHVISNLEKPFPADSIIVQLTGRERIMWDGHDPRALSKKHPGKIFIKTQIYKLEFVIKNFPDGQVKKGLQKFPFQIQLPPQMTPSFFFVGSEGSELDVKYKLTASMGQDSNLRRNASGGNSKGDKIKDAPEYFPLKSKQTVAISQTPENINFNMSLVKEH